MDVTVKDVTPSMKPDKSITVYGIYRKDAARLLKNGEIRFSSHGTSSNKFSFQDPTMFNKALDAFKKVGIKIADKEG